MGVRQKNITDQIANLAFKYDFQRLSGCYAREHTYLGIRYWVQWNDDNSWFLKVKPPRYYKTIGLKTEINLVGNKLLCEQYNDLKKQARAIIEKCIHNSFKTF